MLINFLELNTNEILRLAHPNLLYQCIEYLQKSERWDLVLPYYQRITTLQPNDLHAFQKSAEILVAQKKYRQALPYLNRIVEFSTHQADSLSAIAYMNRGCVFDILGALRQARADHQQAIALAPKNASAHANLGVVVGKLGDLHGALACYEKALALEPDYAMAHWNRALIFLTREHYAKGWREYEWRFDVFPPTLKIESKKWAVEQAIVGQTILIAPEQGLGDVLQFCRYVPHLTQIGAKVIMQTPKELGRLFKSSLDSAVILHPQDQTLPSFDYFCHVMSLPLAFNTTVETIPNQVPYLYAHQEDCWHWQQKIKALPVFPNPLCIGLVWAGGERPDQPHAQRIDRQRSITFAQLAPILDLQTEFPQLQFFSLQKGAAAQAQLHASPRRAQVIDWMNECQDFADTAALIMNVDLVICVDTSVAHLTGALGKPFWLLNRFNTCWRWLLEREDSPWYPTARIFRQPSLGDWDSVIANVVAALQQRLTQSAQSQ